MLSKKDHECLILLLYLFQGVVLTTTSSSSTPQQHHPLQRNWPPVSSFGLVRTPIKAIHVVVQLSGEGNAKVDRRTCWQLLGKLQVHLLECDAGHPIDDGHFSRFRTCRERSDDETRVKFQCKHSFEVAFVIDDSKDAFDLQPIPPSSLTLKFHYVSIVS